LFNAERIMTTEENAELEEACFELARNTKWARKPIDTEEIRALAAQFAEIAKSHIFHGEGLTIDAPLITRSVRYLAQAHGTPGADDTQWFSNMLTALLEVARPNGGLDERAREFLRDMLEGIGSHI
jgi:hypothetical protein